MSYKLEVLKEWHHLQMKKVRLTEVTTSAEFKEIDAKDPEKALITEELGCVDRYASVMFRRLSTWLVDEES